MVPEMVGFALFTGASPPETTSVVAEVAEAWPSAFDAVTTTRSLWSTSEEPGVYDWFVAEVMPAQSAPAAEHRCHWYLNDVGLLLHVPFVAVNVPPSRGLLEPVMVGAAVLLGTAAVAVAARRPATITARASDAYVCFRPVGRRTCKLILRSFPSTLEESAPGIAVEPKLETPAGRDVTES
jgi:hypothetical protein